MVTAYYRCLYGDEFVLASVNSIVNYVDKVYIFVNKEPWGGAKSCVYGGKRIFFPEKIDSLESMVFGHVHEWGYSTQGHESTAKEYRPGNVTVISDVMLEPSIASHAPHALTLMSERPDTLLFMEPDMVWRTDQLVSFINEFKSCGTTRLSSRQVELWRRLDWRVKERRGRASSTLINVKAMAVDTSRESDTNFVHNLGFCASDRAMFWKHMLALGFGEAIGDSLANEDWFEKKWLNWHPETNNKDLEISRGAESNLPYAYKISTDTLPTELTRRNWAWMNDRLTDDSTIQL